MHNSIDRVCNLVGICACARIRQLSASEQRLEAQQRAWEAAAAAAVQSWSLSWQAAMFSSAGILTSSACCRCRPARQEQCHDLR